MKTRTCKVCQEVKPLMEFFSHRTSNGAAKYRWTCQHCTELQLRRCTVCDQVKHSSEFYSGDQRHCKECSKKKHKEAWSNPEYRQRRRAGQKKYRDARRGNLTEYEKSRKRVNTRCANLKKIGWTIELYEQQYEKQAGRCHICGEYEKSVSPNNGGNRILSADHIHINPPIPRRLLCSNCNAMLGFSLDNPKVLLAGAAYLHKYGFAAEPPRAS